MFDINSQPHISKWLRGQPFDCLRLFPQNYDWLVFCDATVDSVAERVKAPLLRRPWCLFNSLVATFVKALYVN